MIYSTIEFSIPLILLTIAALISERSGLLNLGLEGLTLFSAFCSLLFLDISGSIPVAIIAGILSSIALNMIYALSAINLKSNPWVSGLALNLLGPALAASISQMMYNSKGIIRPLEIPKLSNFFFGHSIFAPITICLIIIIIFVFEYSPYGLVVKSCSLSPTLLKQKKRSVKTILWSIQIFTGAITGLAGAFLSTRLSSFVPNISAGRGWIALALLYLSNRDSRYILPSALIFAFTQVVIYSIPNLSAGSSEITMGIPYFLALLLFIITSLIRKQNRNPVDLRGH